MNIQTDEQYFALKELGYLLEKLKLAKELVETIIYEHGGDFEECEGCGQVMNVCRCDEERYSDYDYEPDYFFQDNPAKKED